MLVAIEENRQYSFRALIRMKSISILLLLLSGLAVRAAEPPSLSAPAFQELFDLIKNRITASAQTNVDEAAVRGLLSELKDRVEWVGSPGSESDPVTNQLIGKPIVFDSAVAYFRIYSVERGLAQAIAAARDPLLRTNKISGLVFDLRSAQGLNYEAAANAVDAYFTNDSILLDLGNTKLRSSAKTNAIQLPIAVLVNGETSAAAEAFAVMLRQSRLGLIVGAPTRGRTFQFNQFILSNGQAVRIATSPVKIGDGTELGGKKIQPDIKVVLDRAAEERFLANPFAEVDPFSGAPVLDGTVASGPTNLPPLSVVRRRLTETDLVRQRRGDPGAANAFDSGTSSGSDRVVRDPALARALDFVKGVGRAQSGR